MNQKQNSNTMMRQNDNITVMQKRDDQEMITLLLALRKGMQLLSLSCMILTLIFFLVMVVN